MKKILVLVVTGLLTLYGCSSIKLVGNYTDGSVFGETELAEEVVWTKIIDYFALSGMPITTIDKSSGIIVASNISFVNNYSREDRDGKLINPSAYVVIPTVRGGFGNILEPDAKITGRWDMIGDWNVRIKPNSKGGTSININLLNLRCFYGGSGILGTSTKIPIKSTGVFENNMLQYLK